MTKPCGLVGQIIAADREAAAAAVCGTAVRACRGVRGGASAPVVGGCYFLTTFITGFLFVGFGGTGRVCVT